MHETIWLTSQGYAIGDPVFWASRVGHDSGNITFCVVLDCYIYRDFYGVLR